MIRRLAAWLPAVLFAAVPLLNWGEDFRFVRFALLAAVAALAWLVRPLGAAPARSGLLLAAGPLLAAVSWAVNGLPAQSAGALIEMAAVTFVLWTLLKDERPEDYAYLWIAAVTGATLYGLAQVLGLAPAPLDAYGKPDAASTFGLTNFAAETLAVTIPLGAALFLRTRAAAWRAILPVAALLQITYLLLADSRAGWLALTAAFLVALALWRPADKRALAVLGGVTAAFVATFVFMGGERMNLLSQTDPSLAFRREAWKASLAMTAERPAFGYGPGRFPAYVVSHASERLVDLSLRVRRSIHHPHNEYLRAGAEGGVPGVLWLLAAVAAAAYALVRRRATWAVASLAAGAVAAGVGFPFQQAPFWAALAASLALGLRPAAADAEAGEASPATETALGLRLGVAMLALGLTGIFAVRALAADLSRQAIVQLDAARRIATRDPGRAEVLRARAGENLRRSLDRWPWDAETLYNAAVASPFADQKVAFLSKYVAAMPGDLLAQVTLAEAYAQADRKSDAESTLRALLMEKNVPPEAFHRLIALHIADKRLDDAARTADEALLRFPKHTQLVIDAGDVYRLANDHRRAGAFYDQALALKTDEPGLYLRAGLSALASGDYPKAEGLFRKGHELAPQEAVYLVYLARLEWASNREAEAKGRLLLALKYDSDLARSLPDVAPELVPLLASLKAK